MLRKSLSTFLHSSSLTALLIKFIGGAILLVFVGNYFTRTFSFDLLSNTLFVYTGEVSISGLYIFIGILFALFYGLTLLINVFSAILKLDSLSQITFKAFKWKWSWVSILLIVSTAALMSLFPEFHLSQYGSMGCGYDYQCGPGRYCAEKVIGGGPCCTPGSEVRTEKYCLDIGEVFPPAFLCLSGDTNIATPSGSIHVKDIKQGDIVWSTDTNGKKVAEPVVIAHRTKVPNDHHVIDLKLSDGQELFVTPGHKIHGGRSAGDLRAGDILGNERVISAELVHYGKPYTYDLLPAGATGEYWGNGVLLESTLR